MQTIVWACWAGAVLLMLGLALWQGFKHWHRARAARTWPHVQAVVVEHYESANSRAQRQDGAGVRSWIAVYEYPCSDGFSRRGETVWDTHRPVPLHQPITVCVNPQDPAESYPVESPRWGLVGCSSVALSAFVVASFFFVRVLTQA